MFSVCTYLVTVYFPRSRQLVSQLGYAELLEKQPAASLAGERRPGVQVFTLQINSSFQQFFNCPTKRIDSE